MPENALRAIPFDPTQIGSGSWEIWTGVMPHIGTLQSRSIRADTFASIVMATTPLFWLSPPKQRVRRIQE